VRTAGLWGGGLSRYTHDDWSLDVDHRVVLRSPRADDEQGFALANEDVVEIRAAGFSPSGTCWWLPCRLT
jgi:hypothetical protein